MTERTAKNEKRPKAKVSRYIDAALWDRVRAFASSQDPVVTDSAVIDAALRHYLAAREVKRRPLEKSAQPD